MPHRHLLPKDHVAAGAEVERMVIASLVSRPDAPYAEMERIRQDAIRRNEGDGIHAALVCQSGWFLHWIEGPGPAVRALAQRVGQDPRHHDSLVVHHSRGGRYLPTPWSMMLNPTTEPTAIFGRRVQALHAARQAGVQYPPTSVIRRLAAPLRLAAADAAQEPEGFHRVGVCSAEEGVSFQFLRWLAERQGSTQHPRRVAGEQDLDSASDYVEFVVDGAPCRVIAVSRAGLQHGLRRAFLPDWPNLLLLFSRDGRRNDALMRRVVEACAHLPATPRLLGVSPDVAVHARMSVLAADARLAYAQLGAMTPAEAGEVWGALRERLRAAGAPPNSQWDSTNPSWVA
jgi:hypothetical protein